MTDDNGGNRLGCLMAICIIALALIYLVIRVAEPWMTARGW